MVTLYNVIDIRTMQYHSVAVVKEKNVKWFRPAEGDEEDE